MKILNIMLSRDLGGIQQSFLDYNEALELEGVEVINITSLAAKINSQINSDFKLPNLGLWDIFSYLYLQLIIKFTKPDIIIAHGNRAISFARSFHTIPKIVGVAHNYSLKYLKKCDYVIALTEHMKAHLIKENFTASKIFLIPNMMKITKEFQARSFHQPIIIGTIARFVKKKGVDVFLASLALLKEQRYQFKALIGGDGSEKEVLIKLRDTLNLNEEVTFTGWVEDKEQFFNAIDIFCLPSTHEPFGIIVLEALEYSVPLVATYTEGPAEIIRDNLDGLLCKSGDKHDLAAKLASLMNNSASAKDYAQSGYLRLRENYDIKVVAKKLALFLKSIATK